jgi:hypothetical protein
MRVASIVNPLPMDKTLLIQTPVDFTEYQKDL